MKASFSVLASLAVVSSAVACGGDEKQVVSPVASTRTSPPVASATTRSAAPPRFDYPATRVAEVKDVLFGTEIADPYRWLEDGKAPEVTTWLSAQDAYARGKLAALPGRAELVARLKELFYVESRGVPQRAGKRYFYSKREAQKEKSVVFVSEGSATAEGRVLIDPQTFAADGTGSLGGWEPSQDGKFVAYLKKANNSDEATLFVRDVGTGKDSTVDVIEGAKYGGMSWTPKGDGFYYTWLPPADGKTVTVADRPGFAELRFHKLGTDPKKDVTAHPRTGDAKTFLQGELSRDGHWLFVVIEHGWTSSDVFYKDVRKGDKAPFLPLAVGQKAKYSVTAYKDRFYVRTDDGAPNGRVVRVDPKKPARDAWEVLVPEPKDATLDGLNLVGGQLSIGYLKDVQTRIEMRDLDGKVLRDVALPTVGTASVVQGNPEDAEGFYTFTSFTYPTEIHALDVKSGKSQLHYRLKVPVDPSKFAVEQLFATSKDGTRVPYFVVHAKDFKKDGSAKALVYGYGGFLATQKPGFTSSAYPWLERGGIYVVTNLRGGAEYGEAWHEAGMRRKKQNVFDDLYAIMEKLAADGYTKADRIALRGASNGGLLVATAVTQRPDLFAVGLCGVPLVDMVRFHLFGSGKTWVEEYGSSEEAGDFAAIAAYSPYQHVVPGKKYPSLLVLSADADDRVDPMHARKFAARMQAASQATPASGPVLLRVEKHSGHGGADLVSASVEKLADELAFALAETAK